METIKSVPVYQCNNGHVICKDCIKKLNNCPICRNDSAPARTLQLEKIVQRLEGIPPKNDAPITANPNLQKWGMGSVRSYGTIPNQVTRIEINLQAVYDQAARHYQATGYAQAGHAQAAGYYQAADHHQATGYAQAAGHDQAAGHAQAVGHAGQQATTRQQATPRQATNRQQTTTRQQATPRQQAMPRQAR